MLTKILGEVVKTNERQGQRKKLCNILMSAEKPYCNGMATEIYQRVMWDAFGSLRSPGLTSGFTLDCPLYRERTRRYPSRILAGSI